MSGKENELEQPVPAEWRPVIVEIVENIRNRTLRSKEILRCNISIDHSEIEQIYKNIVSYGDLLVSLPEDAWKTSICRWMRGYWHLLIDLFTVEEGLSDLVLFIDVYGHLDEVCFKIQSVHVP